MKMQSVSWFIQKMRGLAGGLDLSPERYATETDYAAAINLHFGRVAYFSTFVFVILFAPSDFFYLQHAPETLRYLLLWRLTFGVISFLSWRWSLHFPPTYYTIQKWTVVSAVWFAVSCGFAANFGPFTDPWLYITLLIPFSASTYITPFRSRLAATLFVFSAGILAIVVQKPFFFATPFALVFGAYLCAAIALAMLAGDIFNAKLILSYRNFSQLRNYNETLTTIVEARTRQTTATLLDAEVLQEQTRRELSRELHDELGHLIAIHNISLHQFRSKHRENTQLVQASQSFLAELQSIEKGARRVVTELRSNLSLQAPIALSLEEWLYNFSQSNNIEVESLVEPEDLALDTSIAFVASRVIQAAMDNIQQHAEANKAEVCLMEEPESFLLSIRDNGKGFEPNSSHYRVGLSGIEERVNSLGGNLKIQSSPGRGTEVIVRIPHPSSPQRILP